MSLLLDVEIQRPLQNFQLLTIFSSERELNQNQKFYILSQGKQDLER